MFLTNKTRLKIKDINNINNNNLISIVVK